MRNFWISQTLQASLLSLLCHFTWNSHLSVFEWHVYKYLYVNWCYVIIIIDWSTYANGKIVKILTYERNNTETKSSLNPYKLFKYCFHEGQIEPLHGKRIDFLRLIPKPEVDEID